MNTDVLGITALNGADKFSQKERFSMFAEAGFSSVMLAWGGADDRKESILLSEEYGLNIENAHSDMHGCNPIWLKGKAGEDKTSEMLRTVEDCQRYGVKRMVMHLSNGFDAPPLSQIGLNRLEKIFGLAKSANVTLALENVRVASHLRYVLDNFKDDHVRFCFDVGHANIWCKDIPWLELYGDRLVALHLHDNGGKEDDHAIPYTGTVNWEKVLSDVKRSSYEGALSVETEVYGISDRSDMLVFLKKAYASAEKLAAEYRAQVKF